MTRQNHDLSLTDPIDVREAEIAKIAESKEDLAALRHHLREIIEGRAFRGSHRSGQFLVYILDQAIAGRFDSLKERVIGIELFGRSPSYDTGEDAIVRVTASDVRKRLLQHYGESGRSSKFYISLPSGSYIPEIAREAQGNGRALTPVETDAGAATRHSANAHPVAEREGVVEIQAPSRGEAPSHARAWMPGVSIALLLVGMNVVLWMIFWPRAPRADSPAVAVLPWSVFLNSPHATHLITSDPNIVYIQEVTGSELSVSDYANHKFIPEPNKLSPEALRLCHTFLWGDNSAAAVDAPIALRIAAVAPLASTRIDAHAARSIQLSDLKSDDNFIFLGSPRSNPWSALFSDQLDFKFSFDKTSGQEILVNAHPRGQELPAYVPTAQGWATGRSYAIIAFVQNPDQNGQVLLLAGANGEGTEAAGKFATDLPRFSAALTRCGIQSARPLQHFELLLGFKTMAGSPNDVDVVACHILPGSASR
jgi:hypothetical protein